MKILLLGKDGQVGQELQRTLLPLGEVKALGHGDIDLQNVSDLKNRLNAYTPNIIVNAAAYNAVDKAESDEIVAYKINAESVFAISEYARRSGALFVHYSTDYIFDGAKQSAYDETDNANPLNVYGRSKRLGEEAILNSRCNALIFRTSWVFSAKGSNFLTTILKLAQQRDSLEIVADQCGAPTSAELIADVTALALAGYRKQVLANGVYHLTALGEVSWYGFAQYVLKRAIANGAKFKLNTEQIQSITTEQYPLPAKRPKNSRMSTYKLSSALGLCLPDWTIHVNRVVDQLIQGKASI